ncbi:MAG TPA: LLM class F420-dependent oxidoreductase, partial [Acidimicrobiales bacterium]|nr:LLM class F420-dependent oxidoreductase [Acidimicrobiales bacterium]
FDRVRTACEARGREASSIDLSAALVVCVGRNDAEVDRRAANISRAVEQMRSVDAAVGTPAEVVERLRAYGNAGASKIYLQVLDLDDLDHLRLVAEEVMPALA